ncbi:MAG: hypothetical protein LBU42_10130 [Prevotellaceae bacterium]|jgi:hypothetical protein|nr:hypothetical protein [Prevotellaceae bacterium]
MKIVYKHIPGETSPAISDLYDEVVTVNTPVFRQFDDFTQRFILAHERGHIDLVTSNELEADEYAFNRMAGREPLSLRKSVLALQTALPFTHPAHAERLRQQVRRALLWDAQHGNPDALEELDYIDRYASYYDTYTGSEQEEYNRQVQDTLNRYAINEFNSGYKLDTPTIVLLAVFAGFLFLILKK